MKLWWLIASIYLTQNIESFCLVFFAVVQTKKCLRMNITLEIFFYPDSQKHEDKKNAEEIKMVATNHQMKLS